MRIQQRLTQIFVVVLFSASCLADDFVVEDGGVGMSRQELEFIVSKWTPQMQQAAANDLGDRLELINLALSGKKIAAEFAKETPEDNPDRYWNQQLLLRNQLRNFAINNYIDDLAVPDMTSVAQEHYKTQKDKYAAVPEARYTSHILFKCQGAECQSEDKQALAEDVLGKLEAGEDFSAMAAKYSQDPGSKDIGGVFDRWIVKGDKRVAPHYAKATFEIEEIGDLVLFNSQFGIHILRLQEIKPLHYLPYSDVEDKIVAALETEYKKLSAKTYDAQFRISEKAYIDGPAMEEIFSEFKKSTTAE